MRSRAERARRGTAAASALSPVVAAALLLSGCAGGVHKLVPDTPVKIGRPYSAAGHTWVPRDDRGYDTIGEASWYGSREQGRATASGERFDKRRVSAAHPTLPLPSYVEVTRLDDGARMIVRINDRGPYARDRIIDLSREAAHQLGIDRAGHALVRVRRIAPTGSQAKQLRRGYPVMLASVAPSASRLGTGPVPQLPRSLPIMPQTANTTGDPTTLARPVPALPPISSRRRSPPPMAIVPSYAIVIATPDDPDTADALASALAGEGARSEAAGGGYRVVTGPYPDAATRAAALARLRAGGYGGAVALDASAPIQDPNGQTRP